MRFCCFFPSSVLSSIFFTKAPIKWFFCASLHSWFLSFLTSVQDSVLNPIKSHLASLGSFSLTYWDPLKIQCFCSLSEINLIHKYHAVVIWIFTSVLDKCIQVIFEDGDLHTGEAGSVEQNSVARELESIYMSSYSNCILSWPLFPNTAKQVKTSSFGNTLSSTKRSVSFLLHDQFYDLAWKSLYLALFFFSRNCETNFYLYSDTTYAIPCNF